MPTRNAPLAGIGMMLLGILLFSLNDVMGKWLVATYTVGQLLLIRSAAALAVLAPFIARQGVRATLKPERPRLQLVRALLGAVESGLFYLAVSYLPLADTMTIWMAAPVWVVVLAALILREQVSVGRWLAVLAGFVGVVVTLAPSGASLSMPALVALGGSVLFAVMMIAGRSLRGTPDVTLVGWQTVATLLLGAALIPFGWVTPTLLDTGLLALLGIVAMVAHLCVTRSLKLAEASVVVPYQYTLIVWALVFGGLVFGDWPTPRMLAGAALIVAAGLALIVMERRASPADAVPDRMTSGAGPAKGRAMREGLLPSTVATVLELSTSGEKARALTELLGEVFDPTETAISAFEIETGVTTLSLNAPWKVEIYFATHPDEEAVRDMLRPIVGAAIDATSFTTVNQQDWVAASLDGLKPVRAGRVLVHGAHDRDAVRSNDVGIEIPAALAFGTGHHGTTAGCLLALDAELKRRRPRHAIDVGTGTGILALALAKQIKRKVVAGDIDAIAVEVAAHNARVNHAPHGLDLYVAPGLRHAKADRPRHFDLVFANILAGPLRRLAPSIARVLAGDGTVILSGLLAMDVAGIVQAYRHQGLYLARRSLREGWATLVMKKGGAASRPRRLR